jgi:hypothetical protein
MMRAMRSRRCASSRLNASDDDDDDDDDDTVDENDENADVDDDDDDVEGSDAVTDAKGGACGTGRKRMEASE